MGFTYAEDGECIVCKTHTNKYCDSCRRYLCDKHQINKQIKGSSRKHILCKDCYEKGKHPKNADMKGLHPHYHFE